MGRRSFQRVTLSVELTLPPGAKPAYVPEFVREALERQALGNKQALLGALDLNLAIIKITKRETIYP